MPNYAHSPFLRFSPHAKRRQCQHGIADPAIEAALLWGDAIQQRRGRVAWFLGRRAVARAGRHGVDLRAYLHTAVITSQDEVLVTVVRTASTTRLRRVGR
jgi:hypothetical protein